MTRRPKGLDLYCGEGGASMGYHRAGFDMEGVDSEPKPRYPFKFHKGDALEYLAEHGHEYELVVASPPCKSENPLKVLSDTQHPNLLGPTLEVLSTLSVPWIVENVESTEQMPGALILCGTEFGLKAPCRDGQTRWLKRHRRFSSNVFLFGAGGCSCSKKPIGGVYGEGGGGQMTRGYKFHPDEARVAMGIDWMSRKGLSQAIPPAYTQFLGEQLIEQMAVAA